MNQAVTEASGRYIYFLNSGDCFASKEVLQEIANGIVTDRGEAEVAKTVYYGNIFERKTQQKVTSNPHLDAFGCYRNVPCHQACFYSRELLVAHPFQTTYKVQAGDEIIINIPEAKETDLKSQDIPLDVIYEDEDILVVNKPKGMVVHPAVGNPDGTLVNAVMAHCKGNLSGIGGELRPGIVHRLDKDTSGLIIVAKNDKAHINLSEQIKNREVKKVYLALVRGIIPENEATINMPIARSKKDRNLKKIGWSKAGG